MANEVAKLQSAQPRGRRSQPLRL